MSYRVSHVTSCTLHDVVPNCQHTDPPRQRIILNMIGLFKTGQHWEGVAIHLRLQAFMTLRLDAVIALLVGATSGLQFGKIMFPIFEMIDHRRSGRRGGQAPNLFA